MLFRLVGKLFYKNKFLLGASLVYLAAFFVMVGQSYYTFLAAGYALTPNTMLLPLLKFCTLSFVFFTFLAYEYCFLARKSNAVEWLRAREHSYSRVVLCQVGNLLTPVCGVCVLSILLSLAPFMGTEAMTVPYAAHVIGLLAVYYLLVPCIGLLLGCFCALCLPRLAAYFVLVVFVFFSSPLFATMLNGLPVSVQPFGYGLWNLFNLFPLNLEYGWNGHYGFSLLPYQIDLILCWFFFLLCGITAVFAKQGGKKQHKVIPPILAACCVTSLVFYLQPASKLEISLNPDTGYLTDTTYYIENAHYKDQREEAPQFAATHYDMTFDIYRQLKATVQITVSQTDLPIYPFTLFHSYRIDTVKNQAGETLQFEQEGDYFTVTAGSAPTETLTIQYRGHANRFASNVQFTWLPGSFAYYPRPGLLPVYYYNAAENVYGFETLNAAQAAEFQVKINCLRTVHSNLKETGRNTFSGTVDCVSLLSGFLKEYQYEDCTFLYPYLSFDEDWIRQDYLAAKEQGFIPEQITTFLFTPTLNQAVLSEYSAYYQDHATFQSFPFDSDSYYSMIAPLEKQPLVSLLYWYQEQYEFYEQKLEQAQMGPDGATSYYVQFDNKIKQLGDEAMLSLCEAYLEDTQDRRSIQAFFDDLP